MRMYTLVKMSEEKLNYALDLLGKEVRASDIFNEGQYVDAIATTKGKGVQGVVKRWNIRIQYGKAMRSGKGRHVGSIGPWSPERTMWTVAQAGQMGYHKRTEFNKKVLKVIDEELFKKVIDMAHEKDESHFVRNLFNRLD